jgi:hypothetical protein
VEGDAHFVDGDVEGVGIGGLRLSVRWMGEREEECACCGQECSEMDGLVEDGQPVGLGRLEVVFVTNRCDMRGRVTILMPKTRIREMDAIVGECGWDASEGLTERVARLRRSKRQADQESEGGGYSGSSA